MAVLDHFLLTFPKPKTVLRKHVTVYLLYLPFIVFLIFALVAGYRYPDFSAEYVSVATVTDLLYMILAFVALVHWFSMKRNERRDSGLPWIPRGLVVAIGPFLVLALIRIGAPGFSLPGEDYPALLGIGIPAGLALAVVNGAWSGSRAPLTRDNSSNR